MLSYIVFKRLFRFIYLFIDTSSFYKQKTSSALAVFGSSSVFLEKSSKQSQRRNNMIDNSERKKQLHVGRVRCA